ncbi:MAG TPA: lactate racemase domain-containing protein, partial [Actinomycetota bacterium]|nr:lactate racemase domain-containing protein [Actinomycetota bacterium]
MGRPGFVLEVDERTPPLLVHQGEGFRLQKFPLGSRVIYPPDSLPGIRNVRGAIRHALENPVDSEPLRELLTAGMKLTIAIDDISLPLPPMRSPDVRQLVLEEVIELAARQGVEDIKLYMANSLHRRMTADEIKHAVGERVFRSFFPKDLKNHDAEDRDNLTFVGTTEQGEEVELNKRAMESDLLVYVNINLVAMDGGHKSVPVGLASYRSVKHHHNVHTMLHSKSYMDPRPGRSAIHDSCVRMGEVLRNAGLKIFQIETTLNNETFPKPFGFMNKREWEWSVVEQGTYLAAKKANDMGPSSMKHQIWTRIESPYGVTGVNAGAVEGVHERTLERLHEQQLVEVEGQSDVMVVGLPYISPYNVNSI